MIFMTFPGSWPTICNHSNLRAMSHEAIYGQPVQGNLQEEKAFTFECSPISLVDRKTMFENWPVCYQSGHVVKVVKVASCDNALTPCKLSQDGGEDCYKVPGFAFWFLDVLIVSICCYYYLN